MIMMGMKLTIILINQITFQRYHVFQTATKITKIQLAESHYTELSCNSPNMLQQLQKLRLPVGYNGQWQSSRVRWWKRWNRTFIVS